MSKLFFFSGKDTFNCSNVTGTGVTDMLPSQEYISFFKYTIENTCFKLKYKFYNITVCIVFMIK